MSKIDYNELKQLASFLKEEKMKRIRVVIDGTEIELEAPIANSEVIQQPVAQTPPTQPAAKQLTGSTITSPMIGTVYLSAEPGAEPFVTVGSTVKPGQVICIIEAMKMFTKIKAEVSGTISHIHVNNEDPVEFAHPLFQVEEHV